MSDALTPEEDLALKVALAQVRRGEPVTPNIAAWCVVALARLTGHIAHEEQP